VSDLPDFEPYVSLGRIESGPTFEVYSARHAAIDRLVWIKVLREHVPLSSPFAARLTREGQFLARLDHVNVVDIIDCVRRPPRLWLVLEAVDGWTLAEVLAQMRRNAGNLEPGAKSVGLEARGIAALGLQIARALAHTHASGILHGAVWPQHIIVSKHGLCKLSGFSLAENLERQRDALNIESEPGAFEPAYLSPEQVREEPLDERSDLFSLGVVMYELLAGHRPFQGAGDGSMARAIRRDAPEPLAQKNPEVTPELERIVQRCLEKQRERRFDSAGQLVRALEHVLGSDALADLNPMVARALGAAGLAVPSAAPSPRTHADELRQLAAARGLRQSLLGLFSLSAVLLVGGAALHAWIDSESDGPRSATRAHATGEQGELLVVADPWAHVFVDGERLETTPFATPLRLSAGVHHIRLEHPAAPPERREVDLRVGERIVLDVTMKLQDHPPDAGTPAPGSPRPDAGRPPP
jgi:eukaryotic-like serine/threonine-protein kinase